MIFDFFSVLTFGVMQQKQWRLRLLFGKFVSAAMSLMTSQAYFKKVYLIYSQPCSPTPSTTAVAPELRTQKRSPA